MNSLPITAVAIMPRGGKAGTEAREPAGTPAATTAEAGELINYSG